MYSIILELGRESEDRLFYEIQKNEAARERNEQKNRKKKAWYRRRIMFFCAAFGFFALSIMMLCFDISKFNELREVNEAIARIPEVTAASPSLDTQYREIAEQEEKELEELKAEQLSAEDAPALKELGEDVLSEFAIVVDINNRTVVASRKGREKIYPASMTKIMTVLVAAENIEESQLDDTFTITPEITYYAYKNGASSVGFSNNETVTVRDLFYGTILPSGGDAALALATYVAGTEEDFVALMNKELEVMGLSDTTHFMNVTGLYDDDHYSTCYDMAMILNAAINNPLCREVLSTRVYTTSQTTEHPDGITISNWFLRRIEDKDIGGEVICAKTGYVNQSGNCSASYASDEKGHDYICVTGNAPGSWKCIYDHVRIYRQFFPGYVADGSTSDSETAEEEQEETGTE